jgi:hypothetical protein
MGASPNLFLLEGRRPGGNWIRYPIVFASLDEVKHALTFLSARENGSSREYRVVGVVLAENDEDG